MVNFLCSLFALCVLLVNTTLAQNIQYGLDLSSSQPVQPSCIASDNAGNVWIAGTFANVIDIDTVELHGTGDVSLFVAELNSTGRVVWATSVGSAAGDDPQLNPYSLKVTPNGALILGGSFSGTLAVGTSAYECQGSTDMFLLSLSRTGELNWSKRIGNTGLGSFGVDAIYSLAADAQSNLYVAGTFNESVDFDTIHFSSENTTMIFLAKLTPDGKAVWAKSIDGSLCSGGAVAVDSSGNCYVAGNYFVSLAIGDTTLHAENAEQKVFIAKYDASGSFKWARPLARGGYYGFVSNLVAAKDETLYATGYYRADIQFGAYHFNYNSTRYGLYVERLDSEAQTLDAFVTQGSNHHVESMDAELSAPGDVVICGYVAGTATFGSSTISCDPQIGEAFVCDLSPDLTVRSARGFASSGGSAIAYSLADLPSGYAICGTFQTRLNIDADHSIDGKGTADGFVAAMPNLNDYVASSLASVDSIDIYPNPAATDLHVVTRRGSIGIYDVLGREVLATDDPRTIDIRRLPAGTYTVRSGSGSRSFMKTGSSE